ncbi:MAG: FAD-dependent oxidoreductase, partial [Pseudomonadota bacterium]
MDAPVVKDLVLLGGGHSHVSVLRRLGMRPVPGLRVTLVTRDVHTPYSGMLPGFIAGHYDYDECHIDLGPLARFAEARLYHAEVESVDLDNRIVHAADRPPIAYDVLSINTGSRPSSIDIPGVDEFALPVKPIDVFLDKWQQLIEQVRVSKGPFRIVVVGGGAGGVELALSTQLRLQTLLKETGKEPENVIYTIISASDEIMHMHNPGVQKRFRRILTQRNIAIKIATQVTEVKAGKVLTADGKAYDADAILWVTTASAPAWPAEAGLAVDEAGFIKVDEHLQSLSHKQVFAAGDVASLTDSRPKSGVFAVRQGPVLAHNLPAAATGRRLRRYRPQKNFLGLISTGDKYAVASRGSWSYESAWLWMVKDWIDHRFMNRYNELPEMDEEDSPDLADGIADAAAIKELSTIAMRCGGCGAKVGATVLSRVMQRLPNTQRDDVLIGRDSPDDCAMLTMPKDK